MGYRSDVYICIEKKDLPKVIFEPFVDYCEIAQLVDDLVLLTAKDLKLYTTNEWESCKSTIEKLETFHWITIGEDGAIEENYSDYCGIMEVETRVVTPKSKGTIKPNTNPVPSLKELSNFLSLVLSKNFRIIFSTPSRCVIDYNYINLNNTEWYRIECNLVSYEGDTYLKVFSNNPEKDEVISKLEAQYKLVPVTKEGEATYNAYKVYFK